MKNITLVVFNLSQSLFWQTSSGPDFWISPFSLYHSPLSSTGAKQSFHSNQRVYSLPLSSNDVNWVPCTTQDHNHVRGKAYKKWSNQTNSLVSHNFSRNSNCENAVQGPVYMEVGSPGRWGNPPSCGPCHPGVRVFYAVYRVTSFLSLKVSKFAIILVNRSISTRNHFVWNSCRLCYCNIGLRKFGYPTLSIYMRKYLQNLTPPQRVSHLSCAYM